MGTTKFHLLLTVAMLATTACKDDDKGGSSDPAPVEAPAPAPVIQPDQNGSGGAAPVSPVPTPGPAPAPMPTEQPAPPEPAIAFTARPADLSFATSAKFKFEALHFSASAFECSFDGGAFAPCSSPWSQSGLAAGNHVLQVRAGNGPEVVSATYAWTIDQTLKESEVNVRLPSSSLIHEINMPGTTAYIASNKGLLITKDEGATINVINTSDGLPHNSVYQTILAGNYHFAATPAGLAVSTDDWQTLSVKTSSNGMFSNVALGIGYDKTSGRLYVSHTNSGMSYSDDNGATFASVTPTGVPAGQVLSQVQVAPDGRIYIYADNNRVYTATSITGSFTEIIGPSSLNKSVGRIHVAATGRLYAAGLSTGLFYSDDAGATFVEKTMADGLPSNQIQSVVAASDDSTVYVGTNNGLAVSSDGGATFSAISLSALTGTANVRRLNLAADGRLFIGENYKVVHSASAASGVAHNQTDHTAPVVSDPASLVNLNNWNDGISFAWTPATDSVTASNDLIYELFHAPVGTDLSTLAKIYVNGTRHGRYAGVSGAAFYPGDSQNYSLAVVVGDKAGNKSIYVSVDATTGTSPNAQSWSQQSGDTGMGPVVDQSVAQLGSTLYIVGGIRGELPFTVQNKVYKSTDGVNWAEEAQSGSTAERFQHGSTSFNGKLWIAAGTDSSVDLLNDVAFTTDGASWTTTTANAAFTPRSNPAMLTFNGKMWIIGGNSDAGMMNDVWSSSDGVTWTRAAANAGFKAGGSPRVVAHGGYLYFVGEGSDQEVWRSADGAVWHKLLTARPFGASHNFELVAHDSKIYLIGGSATDVWSSPDGIIWEEIDTGSTFPGREDHVAISFNSKIWTWHGINAGYQTDIWAGN